MNLFADTVSLVRRDRPDQLFLVRLVSTPAADNPEVSEVGGAYTNCWIDADDLRTAEQTMLEALQTEGWQAQKFENWELVSQNSYDQDPRYDPAERKELSEQVEQAFTTGYSLVFYCWPINAPDAGNTTV